MILRRIITATAILILSFLLIALLGVLIGGIFGLIWIALSRAVGFRGSATYALSQLGDPSVLFNWLTQTVNWLWNTLIKPVVDFFAKMLKR